MKRLALKTALAAGLFFFSFALAPASARGPESLADLAAEVSDAVVNISAEVVEPKRGKIAQVDPNTPSFDEYFDEFMRISKSSIRASPSRRRKVTARWDPAS